MALLYPWATKEYILWKMSLGQLLMYLHVGTEQKYGKGNKDSEKETLIGKSYEDLKAFKEKLIQQGLIDKQEKEVVREEMKRRYGDI